MDIYVTEKDTGRRIRFPVLPEQISFEGPTRFMTYDILDLGTVKLPSGVELCTYKWEGFLPGEQFKNAPWIRLWTDPREIQSIWSIWRAAGKALQLLVTETPINHGVYLESYTVDYKEAFGSYYYTISFIDDRLTMVSIEKTSPELAVVETQRPANPTPKTYTVKAGDSLWAIANRLYGKGSNYPQIYFANQEQIDLRNKGKKVSRYTIYPGQIFNIP